MKHVSLVKALNKAGFEINSITNELGNTDRFYVKHEGKKLNWIKQNESALCVNVYKDSDEPDAMTDYFPQRTAATIKHAMELLTNW